MLAPKHFGLAAALLAALLALPAAADTTYYVDPVSGQDGSAGHDGTTAALAWRSLAYANANVLRANTANGHVIVVMAAGVYDGAVPSPALEPANGKRYFFLGNPALPGSVRISKDPLGTISQTYVSVRGMDFVAGLTVTGNADSIVKCRIDGPLTVDNCRGPVISQNTLAGSPVRLGGTNSGAFMGLKAAVLEYNTMPNLTISGSSPYVPFRVERCSLVTINRNTSTTTIPPANPYGVAAARVFSYALSPVLKYNNWTIVNNSGTADDANVGFAALSIQDSSRNGTMKVDTVISIAGSSGGAPVYLSNSGSLPGTVRGWVIDSNFVKIRGSVQFADGLQSTNFNYNCVYATGAALGVLKGGFGQTSIIGGKNHVEHNTLVGNYGGSALPPLGLPGAVSMTADTWIDSTYFTHNIVRLEAPYIEHDAADRPDHSLRFAGFFDYAAWDSTFASGVEADIFADGRINSNIGTAHLRSYNNLYDYHGYSGDGGAGATGPGDRSLAWFRNTFGWQSSFPGQSASNYFAAFNEDSASVAGSSSFVDSTLAGWDPTLRSFSYARTPAAGARAYVGTPGIALVPTTGTFSSDASGVVTFTVVNPGDGTLTVSSISSSDGAFAVSPTTASVAAGTEQVVTVTYTKPASPVNTVYITVLSDAPGQPSVVFTLSLHSLIDP